jgi:hypothetical protein
VNAVVAGLDGGLFLDRWPLHRRASSIAAAMAIIRPAVECGLACGPIAGLEIV